MSALALACSDGDSGTGASLDFGVETTRLCSLVPARDPAAAAFPPTPPVKVFGTDLGWTYEVNGTYPILFGDTWQRIDICPIQVNDDSLGRFIPPANDWPGFDAPASIPDEQCPEIIYEIDEAGTAFAPIVLNRWDGVPVPLGPLNTPVTGFYDGETEWGIFIVGGGQSCTREAATAGGPCPTDLSPQAEDLVCGFVANQPSCVDTGSTKRDAGAQALYLHIAERVGPAEYVSRAMFLTNRYLNLTARTVRAFDPDQPRRRDYALGEAALLMWGRPGFDDIAHTGEAPPYFMVHSLPFERAGDQIVFEPRYYRGAEDGAPAFGSRQAEAVPLYTGELAPVNHAAISWVPNIDRWVMIYSGASTDLLGHDPVSQPVSGAMYARVAREAWGPWSDAQVALTNEQTAQDIVCGFQAPAGCVVTPDPLIRPQCIEDVDPAGGGNLYGANIIDVMTRPRGPRAADIFWNYSTWHPYAVVLARTRVEIE